MVPQIGDPYPLKTGEVHLWWVCLSKELEHLDHFQRILSDEEREKAGSFYFRRDRERFTMRRGILRVLLGGYLQNEPGDLRFAYQRSGKPRMETLTGDPPLYFNLSHSHGFAVYALSSSHEVGIDLESTETGISIEEFAETFLTQREIREVFRCPSNRRKEVLLQYWTFREATFKARGLGNSVASKSFEVSLRRNRPTVRMKTGNPDARASLSLHRLEAPKGFVSALAVEGQEDIVLKRYQWDSEASFRSVCCGVGGQAETIVIDR